MPRPSVPLHHTPPRRVGPAHRWLAWLAWACVVLVCLMVLGLYTAPGFMVMLADQVWACF